MNLQRGPQRLGKYELQEQLGRGGMAEVWKAFDPQLQRYVAIKILHADLQSDPEFITRFTREARVIAALNHPNIVKIHDFQTIQQPDSSMPVAYMVMDYIEGRTLAQYIQSTSRANQFPPQTDILQLFASISKAVDYAHQKGMIHRDIKPANILLDKREAAPDAVGEPILTDFGIAKLIDVASGTISGVWLGTPLYISPEQAQGQPGNERSDIYSLGVILYEMCSGTQPFRGESATAIRWQHIHSLPTPPALYNTNITPALAQVILRALAKDPADRFSSASALTAALAEAFHLPVPADLTLAAFSVDNQAGPTYLSPRPLYGQPAIASAVQASPGGPITPPVFPPFPAAESASLALTPTSASPTPVSAPDATRVLSAATTPIVPPPPPSSVNHRPRRMWVVFLLLLGILLLLAGSSISLNYLFSGKPATSPVAAVSPQPLGEVYFLNSGQSNLLNSKGVDDQVQIALRHVPNPAFGKSYYAWLSSVPVGGEGPSILLGTLNVNQGNAQLSVPYQDPQYANLLLNASSFLVTEESNALQPIAPSSDRRAWRFYSNPPAVTLLHLRHLLAGSPELAARQLDGGLGIWFLRNTEKLVEWSSSARDTATESRPDTYLIHRQVIHILDYIDGKDSVSMDVPAGTPLLVDPHESQVALVGPPVHLGPPGTTYQGEVAPGYVYLIPIHINAAVEAPQATASQRQLALQVDTTLDQVTRDLEQARQDASKLVRMSYAQLLTPEAMTLLNDLVVSTQSAYTGPINPSLPQGGAYGVYENIQRMATFDVYQYQ